LSSPDTPDPAEALRLVQTDPHRARRVAALALTRALAAQDALGVATSRRALGLAARELGDLESAVDHLTGAVAAATDARLLVPAAEARMSLSFVHAFRGDMSAALRELELAGGVLRGPAASQLHMQRANLFQLLGRADEALEGYRRAMAAFRRQGDTLRLGRCLNNRGLLWAKMQNLPAAERDFVRAEQIFLELGQDLAVSDVRRHLGLVAAYRGDVIAALALYDLADEYYRRANVGRADLLVDRCDLLLSVRLIAEARVAAQQAVAELEASGHGLDLARARLSLAHAALLEGDVATAKENAEQARRAFVAQRRPSWQALARFAVLRATWLGGMRSPAILAAARHTARVLEAAGWAIPAIQARVMAALLALEVGRTPTAVRELRQASGRRGGGPVELRIQAWYAEALLRNAQGNPHGADAALRAGLRVLDAHRAALGATELRVHSSTHGTELARLGLRLALPSGDARRVLAWAERWRAATMLLRPGTAPQASDAELRRDLTDLRFVVAELEKAALEGKDTAGLLRRQVALERAIRQRSRQAAGARAAEGSVVGVAALRASLAEAVLVELVELDGQLHAVVVRARGLRLHPLGPLAAVGNELDALHFALRRLARAGTSPERARAAGESAAVSAARLDAILLGPLREDLGDGPLVLVPTGALHALPWGLLATCRGRPVSVAPSATLWHRASARRAPAGPSAPAGRAAPGASSVPADPSDPAGRAGRAAASVLAGGQGRVVLVAGPGLPGAAAEVAALRRRYPGATSFTPRRARVEDVLSALDGASLAHIAAHGRFRSDNPLFSSLALGDGPLMVYDIERMRRAPRRIVLSACDSGVSGVRPGDELMGLAAALFAQEAATLVASVVPVSDEATRPLMVAFHKALQDTGGPAAALARVAASQEGADPAAYAASAAFVCFGAGW